MWYINYTHITEDPGYPVNSQKWFDTFPEVLEWLRCNPGFDPTIGLVIGFKED